MTEYEVKQELRNGKMLEDLFTFTEGQDCEIYKADNIEFTDDVIYIPDLTLNEIVTDRVLTEEEIEDLPLYSGNDFLEECNGNKLTARFLFSWVDWQHPNIQDIEEELDENGNVIF